MRQIAQVKRSHDKTVRVMIYDEDSACYLFYFDTLLDGGGFANTWRESATEAKLVCAELFGIEEADWNAVSDPQEDGHHDINAPTRGERNPDGMITLRKL